MFIKNYIGPLTLTNNLTEVENKFSDKNLIFTDDLSDLPEKLNLPVTQDNQTGNAAVVLCRFRNTENKKFPDSIIKMVPDEAGLHPVKAFGNSFLESFAVENNLNVEFFGKPENGFYLAVFTLASNEKKPEKTLDEEIEDFTNQVRSIKDSTEVTANEESSLLNQ